MKLIRLVAIVALVAGVAIAQSVSEPFSLTITSTSLVAVSSPMKNVGQTSHQIYACIGGQSGTPPGASIEIDASVDGQNYFPISGTGSILVNQSPLTADQKCAIVTANGYYPAVVVRVFAASLPADTSITILGTYSGSNTTNPVSGLVRAGVAATKTSPVPFQVQANFAAVTDTATQVIAGPASGSEGVFAYGIVVYNPNSTAVYVAVAQDAGPIFAGTSNLIATPVAPSSVETMTLRTPAYLGLFDNSALNVTCSGSPTALTAPTTACVVSLMYSVVPAVATEIYNGTPISFTTNPSVIPH